MFEHSQGRSVTVNYVYATGIFRNDVYAKSTKSEYFLENMCKLYSNLENNVYALAFYRLRRYAPEICNIH